jgi:hypothetical protein
MRNAKRFPNEMQAAQAESAGVLNFTRSERKRERERCAGVLNFHFLCLQGCAAHTFFTGQREINRKRERERERERERGRGREREREMYNMVRGARKLWLMNLFDCF